ncbi:MAG: cation diffusion facilitator family transporter [Desulfosarcina sp.]|nr:cation diffusion facilitator family transporter [Desulfosarcina sp.]MBC2766161.1 cation diffusion facilitator family transporter [Desulfosarcina sp.]
MEKGEKVALLAIGVNLLLFAIKYTFSSLSGSIALKADAFHSLSDVVASSTVLGGLIIAKRKTRSFPYGLYKVENLASVLVALAILYAGYEIAMEAIKGGTIELQNVWPAVASVVFAIIVSFLYSAYATRVGREINSPSLVADAKHIGVDMFASAAVLVGLLASFAGVKLDRISAFVVVAIIAWSGGKILIDGIRVLLDASLDYQTLSLAEKLILAEPQVMSIQNLMGRNSGRYKFIEANILIKAHKLDKASFIANRIAASISEQIKNVDRVLIHYEPIKKENLIYALPLKDDLQQRISDHFGEAPYFGLTTVRIKDNKAIGQEILANPFTQVEHGKGILVAEFLTRHSVDVVVTKKSFAGKGPFYVFSSAAVESLQTQEDTAEKALEHLGVRYS